MYEKALSTIVGTLLQAAGTGAVSRENRTERLLRLDYEAGELSRYVAIQGLMDLWDWDYRTAEGQVQFWDECRAARGD